MMVKTEMDIDDSVLENSYGTSCYVRKTWELELC